MLEVLQTPLDFGNVKIKKINQTTSYKPVFRFSKLKKLKHKNIKKRKEKKKMWDRISFELIVPT